MTGKSLMRRNRYGVSPFERLTTDMGSIFKDFFGDNIWDYVETKYDLLPTIKGNEFPKVNVLESDDGYAVEIAVAGFSKEDVFLTLKDNQLIISAEKKEEKSEGEDKNYLHKEIAYRSFSRVIGFPKKVMEDSCDAKYENGIINVSFKKAELEEKPDRIMIEIK